MSCSKKLDDIVEYLLLAPLLKSKNTEDLSYVAAWLLSRFWKKDSELFMSSPDFGENLP
jgi:hypothetical protein